ncbi:M15 family metallopeptidase [Nocardioides humilatus]|uniref:M15 family metallopeptidase n=1 Tax=Nocardioides humilatus TaxID=2607660 RepID=A0A5B1LK30_9ACTN|nr:M15 family metallopeptidase [Nocardioides humilatus]KAA1421095.1 M15 family metallopeptidase [Nocardioides humilatus]
MNPPLLLSDPQVSAVPVLESGDPLVALHPGIAPDGARVRAHLADRLYRADLALPTGIRLRVVEGHRSVADQRRIIDAYSEEVRRAHPAVTGAELDRLVSRFVAPLEVAPHVAGAAVDLTLVDESGSPLDLGTPIDATPEQSGGRCYFASPDIGLEARALRLVLADALSGAGLVNYPTEWWHWSYGDRYWALMTGAAFAPYGPVDVREPAGAGR